MLCIWCEGYQKPIGSILLPSKPYNGFDASFNCFLSRPICSKAERNRISSGLPLSTSTLVTFHFLMCATITIASGYGKDMSLISASVKVRGMCDHLVRMIGPFTAT
jgi:hypothetical protein